jgi:drug/metabolite transporter (DMT)-like permease
LHSRQFIAFLAMAMLPVVMEEPAAMEHSASTLTAPAAAAARLAAIPAGVLGIAFVILWSTGYPAARLALDHSAPFTLLVLRFGAAGLIFAALAGLGGVAWPRGRAALHSAVVGALSLALQFGPLYFAAARGVNVGLIALVIGTMPIVTALLGLTIFKEAVRPLQWLGFALGIGGVALAVGEGLGARHGAGAGLGAYLAVLIGLIGISTGTLYQKRHGSDVDPRSGLALQQLVAALLLLPLALYEGFRFDGSVVFLASLGWVIGVNSLAAFALLFVLLRRGALNQVATLFFLMPPVTAVIDYAVLGDALTPFKVAGLVLAALGVWLATRAARSQRAARGSSPLTPSARRMNRRRSSGARFTHESPCCASRAKGPEPWASSRSKASMALLMTATSLLRQRSYLRSTPSAPGSSPTAAASASSCASVAASSSPRFTPCPASGCTTCAASPVSATRCAT